MKCSKLLIPVCILSLFAGCASINRSERAALVQHNVNPAVYDRMVRGDVLTLSDIIELSQRQVPDKLVINYLYSTRAVYSLDKQGLERLRKGCVPQNIINYLLDTSSIFGPRYVYGDPCYSYAPYYYPYPYYAPVYGSASVVFVRGHGRWR